MFPCSPVSLFPCSLVLLLPCSPVTLFPNESVESFPCSSVNLKNFTQMKRPHNSVNGRGIFTWLVSERLISIFHPLFSLLNINEGSAWKMSFVEMLLWVSCDNSVTERVKREGWERLGCHDLENCNERAEEKQSFANVSS